VCFRGSCVEFEGASLEARDRMVVTLQCRRISFTASRHATSPRWIENNQAAAKDLSVPSTAVEPKGNNRLSPEPSISFRLGLHPLQVIAGDYTS